MNKLAFILCLLFSQLVLRSQKLWNLKDCIDKAYENNLSIASVYLDETQARTQLEQSKRYWLPTITANFSPNYNMGYTIDPTTNSFQNVNSITGSAFTTAQFTIFQGNQNKNTIEKIKLELEASGTNKESSRRRVAIAICNSYLEILLAKQILETYENQVRISRELAKKTLDLISLGNLPRDKAFEVNVQLAKDEANRIKQENNIQLLLIKLKQLINITEKQFEIAPIEFSPDQSEDQNFRLSSGYFDHNPFIQTGRLKLSVIKKSIDIQKGTFLPSITLGVSIGTNFINTAKIPVYQTFDEIPVGYIKGQNETLVYSLSSQTIATKIENPSVMNQISSNLQQRIGLSIQYPIFDKLNKKTNIKLEEINYQRQEIQLEKSKQELVNEVATALINIRNAHRSFLAIKHILEAEDYLRNSTKEKYELGLTSFFEYQEVENKFRTTQIEYNRSKYEWLFRKYLYNVYLNGVIE